MRIGEKYRALLMTNGMNVQFLLMFRPDVSKDETLVFDPIIYVTHLTHL